MKHITQQTAVDLAKKLEDGWADGPAEDYPNYDAGTWQLCNAAIDHYLSTLSAELPELPEPVALLDGVPLGAHTVGEVMELCERWRVAGGREEHHAYKEEIERVVEKLVSDRDVLLQYLDLMFFKYEEGIQCYEDPEDCTGFIGHAIRLDDAEFEGIVEILNRLAPRAAIQKVTK